MERENSKSVNSICIEYTNNKFFIGLANIEEEKEPDVKAYMECGEDFFQTVFKSIINSIANYDKLNDADFLQEFIDTHGDEVINNE